MIRELTDDLLGQVEANLGPEIKIVLSPSIIAIGGESLAKLPALVFQGPTLQHENMDYETQSEAIVGPEDAQKYGLKKWRSVNTLVFRVRFFHDSLIKSVGWLERLVCLSGMIVKTDYGGVDYDVEFDSEYDGDTVPNLSDLKHFESEVRILGVPIRPEGFDEEVFALKESKFIVH